MEEKKSDGNTEFIQSSNAKDLFKYLLTLKEDVLDGLYKNIWTCKAVFRSLSPLAQQFILRLILIDEPVHIHKLLESLVQKENNEETTRQWKISISSLVQLRICIQTTINSTSLSNTSTTAAAAVTSSSSATSNLCIKCNNVFKETFREYLTQEPTSNYTASSKKPPPTLEFLQDYAKTKWENVLKFMLDVTRLEVVGHGVKGLLEWSKLVKEDTGAITSEGFQFLLQDIKTQVWILLRAYLNTAKDRNQVLSEIIQFLFELSFLIPGQPYSAKTLTSSQKSLLVDLASMFGLVYIKTKKSSSANGEVQVRKFYTTPLASGILIMNESKHQQLLQLVDHSGASSSNQQGYLIVETNYRVYAYTDNVLQIALLSIFVFLEMRLPNMVVGMITRDSIGNALNSGITADQILAYIYKHAHPEMKKHKPVIPETVADQIHLWEQERNRVQFFDCVLYEKFPNQQVFERVVKYAKEIEVFLWSSTEKMQLVTHQLGHEKIAQLLKTLSQ